MDQAGLFEKYDIQAVNLLKVLISHKGKRVKRSTETLKPPNSCSSNWYLHVPAAYNDNLDIKLTERIKNEEKVLEWTQGSEFSFKPGYIFYDSPDGYLEWGQAIKKIKVCLQIDDAADVLPESKKVPRNPGYVRFTVYVPNKNKDNIKMNYQMTLTQDEFVHFLITGEHEIS